MRLPLFLLLVLAGVVAAPAEAHGASYYLDCRRGNDHASGQAPASAWRSLNQLQAATFRPGDRILLRRGTTCSGMLAPRGSGATGAPITIDAYGAGPLPRIDAGAHEAAIRLYNQHGWEIAHVETIGGNPRGIFVGADHGTQSHIRISDVVVHGVRGAATQKDSGLIDIEPKWGSAGHFDDVVVYGARAYGTKQWVGIHVGCMGASAPAPNRRPVIIRNSTVHDVAGDGITIFSCSKGLIENNVAYRTGRIRTKAVGTPNAIWTWSCRDCTVQGNEGYDSDSPDVDGGIYDIDFHSSNTTVQYNYGHDAHGYCVAIFGAERKATTNSVVRYNVCANNAREKGIAYQGDIELYTWNGGSLDGVAIYNNTFYWNPAADKALLYNAATFTGSGRNFFENNIVYATASNLVDSNNSLALNHNLYWTTSATGPFWKYAGKQYAGFAAYRDGTKEDAHGKYADPRLISATYHGAGRPALQFRLQPGSPAIDAGANVGGMGSHDFFGDAIPRGTAYDIGADEH